MTIPPCYPSECPDGSQQNLPIEPISRINFYHVRPCQSIKNINRPVKLVFWDLPPNKLNKNKVSRKQLFISSPHSKVKFSLLVALFLWKYSSESQMIGKQTFTRTVMKSFVLLLYIPRMTTKSLMTLLCQAGRKTKLGSFCRLQKIF